jgi:hypothetical protein
MNLKGRSGNQSRKEEIEGGKKLPEENDEKEYPNDRGNTKSLE